MRANRENNVIKLLKGLFKLKPIKLKAILHEYLNKYYSLVVETEDYLYAEGNIPIALVAHLDTVFDKQPEHIFYDPDYHVMWSIAGLGADDRAGVFGILKIISDGFRPHIIFTMDEEIGGIGASELAKIECPFNDLRYIIELDRRGIDDCVFYQCGNEQFKQYVESFGFIRDFGSFSDISFLCPGWNVAGVNLSIGYFNEHSPTEHLFLDPLFQTVHRVEEMLSDEITDIPYFNYCKEKVYAQVICSGCKKVFDAEECVLIRSQEGMSKFYCETCLDQLNWCTECGEPYIYNDREHPLVCSACRNKLLT